MLRKNCKKSLKSIIKYKEKDIQSYSQTVILNRFGAIFWKTKSGSTEEELNN